MSCASAATRSAGMRSAETRLEGKAGEGGRQTGARHVARCGVGVSFSSRGTRRISWRKSAASPLGPQQSCRGRLMDQQQQQCTCSPSSLSPTPPRATHARQRPLFPLPPSPPNKHSAQRQQLQQLQARRERGGCKRVPALRRAGRAVHCAPHRPRDVRGARVGAPPRLVGAPPPLAWGPRCAPRGGPLQAPFLGEGRTGRPARRAPGGPVRVTCGSCDVAPLGTERLM